MQLVELQNNAAAFQEAGVQVVAVFASSLDSVTGIQASTGVTYPVLADPDHQAAEAYGVYNLLGDGLAAPAVFVVDTDGRIVWGFIGQNVQDRPGVQTILEHLP